jgi:hypothetical protein
VSPAHRPATRLSVVLITDHFRTIARVVRHLGEQTVRGEVEIVIVCPSARSLEADEQALSGFASVAVKEIGALHPMSAARAAGVRVATAPIRTVTRIRTSPRGSSPRTRNRGT